jgi:hypothetical protein
MKKEDVLDFKLGIEWEKVRQSQITAMKHQKAALEKTEGEIRVQQKTAMDLQEVALFDRERINGGEGFWVQFGRLLERVRRHQLAALEFQRTVVEDGTGCLAWNYMKAAVRCQEAATDGMDTLEEMLLPEGTNEN